MIKTMCSYLCIVLLMNLFHVSLSANDIMYEQPKHSVIETTGQKVSSSKTKSKNTTKKSEEEKSTDPSKNRFLGLTRSLIFIFSIPFGFEEMSKYAKKGEFEKTAPLQEVTVVKKSDEKTSPQKEVKLIEKPTQEIQHKTNEKDETLYGNYFILSFLSTLIYPLAIIISFSEPHTIVNTIFSPIVFCAMVVCIPVDIISNAINEKPFTVACLKKMNYENYLIYIGKRSQHSPQTKKKYWLGVFGGKGRS